MTPLHESSEGGGPVRRYLVASDFDQTLSFNDSGATLAQLLGVPGFDERVAGLAHTNLVHQGGELAYLIRHDPEFRGVPARAPRRDRAPGPPQAAHPLLEDIVGWERVRIRALLVAPGLEVQDWTRSRTDWVSVRPRADAGELARTRAS